MALYHIARVRTENAKPELKGYWDGRAWASAEALDVASLHEKSSDHRPRTQAKLLYDERNLYVIFRVEDRYVRSVRTGYQGEVWKDSCVESFLQPHADLGYFNFETNCGGALLLHYNVKGTAGGKPVLVSQRWLEKVRIYHSVPSVVSEEIKSRVTWFLEYAIPFDLFDAYVRPVRPVAGAEWRANFYKCASDCSHPHWASWSPIGEELTFHAPQYFGRLVFEA